jgi:hypothetical protein
VLPFKVYKITDINQNVDSKSMSVPQSFNLKSVHKIKTARIMDSNKKEYETYTFKVKALKFCVVPPIIRSFFQADADNVSTYTKTMQRLSKFEGFEKIMKSWIPLQTDTDEVSVTSVDCVFDIFVCLRDGNDWKHDNKHAVFPHPLDSFNHKATKWIEVLAPAFRVSWINDMKDYEDRMKSVKMLTAVSVQHTTVDAVSVVENGAATDVVHITDQDTESDSDPTRIPVTD